MNFTRFASIALMLALVVAGGCQSVSTHAELDSTKGVGPLAEHPAARMVGNWKGTATSLGRDGQWHQHVGIERAHWNLAGTAIMVEGYGYGDDPTTGVRTVGHDACGVIEYDAGAKVVRFHAKRAGGNFGVHTLEADSTTGQMRWSPTGAGNVSHRFTINITADRWVEVGEVSRDNGQTWSKFLETNLARVE
ncbi:MAG: hypothetical protein H7210_11405 [Pyrinomonadaceae bacterium]|nr:hypothetical protein [Phycisphaerales bacterium]